MARVDPALSLWEGFLSGADRLAGHSERAIENATRAVDVARRYAERG
jgi:hypothetical protein